MELEKLDKLLKVGLLISFIILFGLIFTMKMDNCDICSFDYNGTKLSVNQFTFLYADTCLFTKEPKDTINISNTLPIQ